VDPALHGLVTISGADVSPDLKLARVYFTCMGNGADPAGVERHLNSLAPHFRHQLAAGLAMRTVPRLQFAFDASVERGSRISALLQSLHREGE
jgi:ribosome-binding factor A